MVAPGIRSGAGSVPGKPPFPILSAAAHAACAACAAFMLAIMACATAGPVSVERPQIPAPAAPAIVTAPAAADPLASLIGSMTLREKIAQHFIVWIPRNTEGGRISALKELKPAGYILYPWNFKTVADVRTLTAELSDAGIGGPAMPAILPFICADQEGGRVATFRFKEFPAQPSAFLLGSLSDAGIVEASAYSTALQLEYLGLNMDLAPVADLYALADATIIGDRSFGADSKATGASVAAYVNGLSRGGIIATLKHFPGHGSTTVDSHADLPVVPASLDELRSGQLIPFIAGLAAGAPVVMTAHILYPAMDAENPATLSPFILNDLLRGELGFQGIILTDGFEMGALSKRYGKAEALARALDAGVNLILLYDRYEPAEMMDLVEGLVREGRVREAALDANLLRILGVKREYGLLASTTDQR